MSTKSQVLRVIFRTPEQVDIEPPSVADSLRECVAMSPRAWEGAVDADVVKNVEDDICFGFFFS
jgi:hypothetical protein